MNPKERHPRPLRNIERKIQQIKAMNPEDGINVNFLLPAIDHEPVTPLATICFMPNPNAPDEFGEIKIVDFTNNYIDTFELMEAVCKLPKTIDWKNTFVDNHETYTQFHEKFYTEGLPIFTITFGLTEQSHKEVCALYSIQGISPHQALERLQSQIFRKLYLFYAKGGERIPMSWEVLQEVSEEIIHVVDIDDYIKYAGQFIDSKDTQHVAIEIPDTEYTFSIQSIVGLFPRIDSNTGEIIPYVLSTNNPEIPIESIVLSILPSQLPPDIGYTDEPEIRDDFLKKHAKSRLPVIAVFYGYDINSGERIILLSSTPGYSAETALCKLQEMIKKVKKC